MLGVEEDCTDEELKGAYLEKAKAYHPDSATSTADPYKFSQIKDAYKAVLVGSTFLFVLVYFIYIKYIDMCIELSV